MVCYLFQRGRFAEGRFAMFHYILDVAELASLAAFLTLIALVARSVGAA
jgi:hypothetical protein